MIPALLLVLVFAVGLLVEAIKPMGGSAATAEKKTVDSRTDMTYEEALGSTQSTRYSGRVWADKTVYIEDVNLDLPGYEGDDIVRIGDDDFLIGYSLLTATTVVSGRSVVPLDVVFVIDLSLSMAEDDRIGQTVLALNQAAKTLLNGHPDTRIAVVTYNTEAKVLLPLDHYSVGEGQDYLSLTGQGENQILCAHVIDSEGQSVESTAQMSGPTNIHMGVDVGMDLLLNAEVTTDSGVDRHPALMLMSDGAPTCSGSNESDWWNPSGVSPTIDPDVTGSYTLRAVMNAAFQKQRVTEHYSSQGRNMEMQVYTVGVGVDSLDSTGKTLAQVTLNPSSGLSQNSLMAQMIKSAWEEYRAGGKPTLGTYTFNHPESGDVESVYYNDGYFYAENSSDIANAFDQVLEQIIVTGAVPTEVDEDPAQSGYITYTDPIGEYMEVKDVKALVWDEKVYTYKTTSTGENWTTYTFIGTMVSPVYGEHWFSEILITVTTDPVTKNQTLEVKVPAALIPVRKNTVELNDDGTVASNDCINAEPLRLFYTVGMREDVLTADKTVDLSKIDSDYVEKYTNDDGTINLFANRYSGNTEGQGGGEKTVGDAYVSFVPAPNNPFYFNQTDVLVYADEDCKIPAQPGATVVYVKVPYYDRNTETGAIEETFEAVAWPYSEDDIKKGTDGYLYLEAGSQYDLSGYALNKGKGNITQTASIYYYPTYTYAQDGSVSGVKLSLGNNGIVAPPVATGDLTISKTVTGNMGEKCREFTFYITMYHGGTPVKLDGSYEATLTSEPSSCPEPSAGPSSGVDPSSTPSIGSGEVNVQFIHGKAEIKLKHGQSITIHDLPTGYVYTVWEDNPDTEERDYTVTATQNGQQIESWNEKELACTGTIQNKQNDQLAYTNKCYVPMVNFSFIKVDGLSFDSTDLDGVITLSGAEFALYQYTGTSWETDKGTLMNPASEYAVWSQVGDLEISDEKGVVTFDDLRAGNYRLVETSAPDGYQLPKGQWNLTVSISGAEGSEVGDFAVEAIGNSAMDAPAMAKVEDNQGNVTYYLMNYKPINPPVTGGDGGEDFRIGGGLLMFTGLVLAMWWMWSSPRRRSEFL